MSGRDRQIAAFLTGAGWDRATRVPLAGDASSRRYDRLTDPVSGQTSVLMIAAEDDADGVSAFTRLSNALLHDGLSAPLILASDEDACLLLLEDLGDATFTRILSGDLGREPALYAEATDLLVRLRGIPVPSGLVTFDSQTLAEMTGITFERYGAPITGSDAGPQIIPRLAEIFHATPLGAPVLLHRDYHADNLLWLPGREGVARVGLLDFQDAVAGPMVYDLVSLLQDARRDVSPGVEMTMLNRFRDAAGLSDHDLRSACAVVGLQRNLRILGVFARLAQDFGKPHYLDLMPRVYAHVERNLEHPVLAPVAQAITDALPRPTPQAMARLGSA